MTTYTLTGVAVHRTNGNVVGVTQNIQWQIVVPDGVTSFFYSLLPLQPGQAFRNADISIDDYNMRVTGSDFDAVNGGDIQDALFLDIVDSNIGPTSIIFLSAENNNVAGLGTVDTEFLFDLYSVLPPITTVAEWNAFQSSVESIGNSTGTYGPEILIPLTSLGAVVSENDLIEGTSGNEDLRGGAGNDTIMGFGGSDRLEGGDGDDSINTGDNDDFDLVETGSGNDTVDLSDVVNGYVDLAHYRLNAGITAHFDGQVGTLTVDKGVNGTTTVLDVLDAVEADGFGLSGSDYDDVFNITRATGGFMQIRGGAGDDTYNIFEGGGGTVRLTYRESNLTAGINANLATGVIIDSFGDTDTLGGTGFFTDLRATMFADNIVGSDRDERFITMGGNDTVDGGGGWDIQRYDRSGVSAVTVNLNFGNATGTWTRDGIVSSFNHMLTNIEEVHGSREGNDLMIGSGLANILRGNGGNDTVFGGNGNDTLYGGAGVDLLGGGLGNDLMYGQDGNDAVYTADGDDTAFGGNGNDTVGGAGGNDELHGEDGADQLWGAVGDDTLYGGAGNDTLGGSVGNDVLFGDDGDDEMWGSTGNDSLTGGIGNDTLGGSVGNDTLFGEDGNDEMWGADGVDSLIGGSGNDTMGAGIGDDFADGGDGNDQMFGGQGNDSLLGGIGNDTIFGAEGDDTIDGGDGDDEMYAGPGADVIVFSTGDDTAFFFSTADDLVDLTFAFGITDFADLQNNHLTEVGGSAVITDGSGFSLTLRGVSMAGLSMDDFIF